MDPLSLTVSTVALLGFIGDLVTVTTSALHCAKTLAKSEASYNHVANLLSSSNLILQRLYKLKVSISEINDIELQSLNLPSESLTFHYKATEALSTCLQTHRRQSQGRFRRLQAIAISISSSKVRQSELETHIQRFNDSKDCIGLLLDTFQA